MGGGSFERVSLFETSSNQWQERNSSIFYLFLYLEEEME